MNLTASVDPFPTLVGQNRIKKQLKFYQDCHLANGNVPHLLFSGAMGLGKTKCAEVFAKSLLNPITGKTKKRIELNAQAITSPDWLFKRVFIPHIANSPDSYMTLTIDEIHLLPESVVGVLLTILNLNKDNITTYSHEEYEVKFDFNKITFLTCTSEAQKIFGPLKSRFEVLSMEEYSCSELIDIIEKTLENKYKIEDTIKEDLASVVRGSARDSQKISSKIKNFLTAKNSNILTYQLWREFKDSLSILPYGLSSVELEVLEHLAGGNLTLTALAAKTGLSTSMLRLDTERYLLKHNLLKIDINGRGITAKGLNLLAKTRGAAII